MFGRNSKVNLELNREVEKLIKTGGKEQAARSAAIRPVRSGAATSRPIFSSRLRTP